MKYAAYTEDAIWETGDTPQEAIDAFLFAAQADLEEVSPLYTAPMTDRLAAWVEEHGFDAIHDSFRFVDGKLDLPADDLLAVGDIAQLVGVTTDAVQQWGKRHPAFRALAEKTSAGLIWHREDVEQWLRDTGRLK